jgi:hypothetical protein
MQGSFGRCSNIGRLIGRSFGPIRFFGFRLLCNRFGVFGWSMIADRRRGLVGASRGQRHLHLGLPLPGWCLRRVVATDRHRQPSI